MRMGRPGCRLERHRLRFIRGITDHSLRRAYRGRPRLYSAEVGRYPGGSAKGCNTTARQRIEGSALAGRQLQKARICLRLDSARLPFLRFAVEAEKAASDCCPFGICWFSPKANRFGCQNGRAVMASGRFGASRQAQNVPLAQPLDRALPPTVSWPQGLEPVCAVVAEQDSCLFGRWLTSLIAFTCFFGHGEANSI